MTIAFNEYQSLESVASAPGAPNRCVPERIKELALLEHLTKDSSVLDIGCNRGYFGICLSPHIRDYTGIEHSSEVRHGIDEAAARGLKNLNFVEAPFGRDVPGKYDMILLLAIILYIDTENFAEWLEDHLNPGGVVIIEGHPRGYMGEPEATLNPLVSELNDRMDHALTIEVRDRELTRQVFTHKRHDAAGMASRVFFQNGLVRKKYRKPNETYGEFFPGGRVSPVEVASHWKNEAWALRHLFGVPGVPVVTIIDDDNKYIVMENVGAPVTKDTLPDNWREQLESTTADMASRGVYHADARPKNICVKDGKLTLIDFGMVYNTRIDGWAPPIEWIERMISPPRA